MKSLTRERLVGQSTVGMDVEWCDQGSCPDRFSMDFGAVTQLTGHLEDNGATLDAAKILRQKA